VEEKTTSIRYLNNRFTTNEKSNTKAISKIKKKNMQKGIQIH